MKLVFATHNPNKLKEVQLLVPSQIELINLETIGCTTDIPETAITLEGNAKLKANFITKNYQLSCFADDTRIGMSVNSDVDAGHLQDNLDKLEKVLERELRINPFKSFWRVDEVE